MRKYPTWLVALLVCVGVCVGATWQLVTSQIFAILVHCKSDWLMAGKPRGEDLKKWEMTSKLEERCVEVEEFVDGNGDKKVVVWRKTGFLHKKMGLHEDSTNGIKGVVWGTYK